MCLGNSTVYISLFIFIVFRNLECSYVGILDNDNEFLFMTKQNNDTLHCYSLLLFRNPIHKVTDGEV